MLMRQATSNAISKHSLGGNDKKQGSYVPKPVTLPTLETARKITREEK